MINKSTLRRCASSVAVLAALASADPALANFNVTAGTGTAIFAIDGGNQGTALCSAVECPAHVSVNTAGAPIGVSATPWFVTGAGGTFPATLNVAPSLANGNGMVPTQGGAVLSATNGIFSNLLQGNVALSATNGLFANLSQWGGSTITGTVNAVGTAGTGNVPTINSYIVGPLGPSTTPTNAQAVTDTGTPITAAGALASGGQGVTGWLSQIWTSLSGPSTCLAATNPATNSYANAATASANCNLFGALFTNATASTVGGAGFYHLIAAATTNSTLVSTGAHTLYSVQLGGIGAAPAYLKVYDKATAPTCNSDPVAATYMIPASPTAALGGGSNVPIPIGMAVTLGLGICVVTGIADNDNTAVAAATYIVNLQYK